MKHISDIHLGAGILTTAFLAAATVGVQAQNVGIGTAAPASKLTVNGNLAVGAGAPYTNTAAPEGGAIIQGTVGIGTDAPDASTRLHVVNGSILQSTTGGANYSLIAGGGMRSFRDGAASPTFPWVNGFFDVHDRADGGGGGFAGRMFAYIGDPAAGADVSEGRGLAFSVAPLTAAPHLLVSSADTSYGNVGIGDTTPTEARLVVRGGVVRDYGDGQRFGPQTNGVVEALGTSGTVSIYAANQIWSLGNIVTQNNLIASTTLTPSDSRLKNILGASDAAADLETLGKIRVTDYTLKDTAAARGTIKKVVAQQVEEVYPRAVSKSTGWLPDIQAFGAAKAREKGVFEISMERPHGLATGAKLKIIVANGEAEFATVQSVTENTFTAKLEQTADGDKVFVYGRQTDDLRAVDYDALSMLNISATQELARRLQTERTENEAQQAEIVALKAQLTSLKAQNEKFAALAERMESLEKIVINSSSAKSGEGTPVLAR